MAQSLITTKHFSSFTKDENFSFTHAWGGNSINTILPLYIDSPKIIIPNSTENWLGKYFDAETNNWSEAENFIFFRTQTACMINYDFIAENYFPINGTDAQKNALLNQLTEYFLHSTTGTNYYTDSGSNYKYFLSEGSETGGIINNFFSIPTIEELNPENVSFTYNGLNYNENPPLSSETLNYWVCNPNLLQSFSGYYVGRLGKNLEYGFNFPYNKQNTTNYKIGAPILFKPYDLIRISVQYVYNQSPRPETRIGPNVNYTRIYFGIAPKTHVWS